MKKLRQFGGDEARHSENCDEEEEEDEAWTSGLTPGQFPGNQV